MGFNRAAHCYMVNGKVQPMFGYQSMDAYSDIVSYTWSGDWQKCGGICGSQASTMAPVAEGSGSGSGSGAGGGAADTATHPGMPTKLPASPTRRPTARPTTSATPTTIAPTRNLCPDDSSEQCKKVCVCAASTVQKNYPFKTRQGVLEDCFTCEPKLVPFYPVGQQQPADNMFFELHNNAQNKIAICPSGGQIHALLRLR